MMKDTGRWLPPRQNQPKGPYSSHMVDGKRIVISGAIPPALKKGILKYYRASRFDQSDCVVIDPLIFLYEHLETIAEQVGMTIKYIGERSKEAKRSIDEDAEVMDNILYDADRDGEDFDSHKYRRAVGDMDATGDSIVAGYDETSGEVQSIMDVLNEFADMIGRRRYDY